MFGLGKKKQGSEPAEKKAADTKRPAIGDHTQIKLGDLVRDRVQGSIGVAIERQFHLNGCEFLLVELEGSSPSDKVAAGELQRWELIEARPELHREIETPQGAHVKLGDEVKDTLTGWTGHAVIWSVPLFGVDRIYIDAGMKKDGSMHDYSAFDESRIELIKAKNPPQVKDMKPARKRKGSAHPMRMARETMAR